MRAKPETVPLRLLGHGGFTSVFTMVFTLFDHGFRWVYHLGSDSRAIDQVLGVPSLGGAGALLSIHSLSCGTARS